MATKNIVPRANGEGGIGTSVKRWLNGFFKNINVDTEAIVPTPDNNENSTKAATTAWVENVFFTKLVAKLLATTAATITSLSTSSLFYRFLAQALSVAGVQYNLSNSSAWYICLGSLFGGLIIQGGNVIAQAQQNVTVTYPISFSILPTGVAVPNNNAATETFRVSPGGLTATTMNICCTRAVASSAYWLVIGW